MVRAYVIACSYRSPRATSRLRVQLVVLLRADGPHPVTDQSGAALGECVELAGTLDPAVPELCRRPELQCT
jgi:hypothetical protein